MAKLHFANLAPSAIKGTLLAVLDDSHVFTRKGYKTLERHVKRLGFTEYKLSRFNNGERRTVERVS